MLYTKKSLKKLLEDNNVTTTAKSIAALLLLALDNGFVSREDVLQESAGLASNEKRPVGRPRKLIQEEPKEKRPVGRPRKYEPKIVDPDAPKDPKYDRLRAQSKVAIPVTITNVATGEVRSFKSQYKAAKMTGKREGFFARYNGKVVDGELIQLG